MPRAVTHKDVMGKLCGICLGKLSLRQMSDAALGIIKKHVWAGYTKGESPHKVCGSCYQWLLDVDKSGGIEAAKRKPPVTFNRLRDLAPPRQTRGSASGSSECQCGYCPSSPRHHPHKYPSLCFLSWNLGQRCQPRLWKESKVKFMNNCGL